MNGFGYKVCMMKQCHIIIPRRMTSCKVLTKFDILAHAFIIYFNLFSLSKFLFPFFFLIFPLSLITLLFSPSLSYMYIPISSTKNKKLNSKNEMIINK